MIQKIINKNGLIDDFSSGDGRSLIGTSWDGVTDQVMGGISDMKFSYNREQEISFVRMEGNVSLKNNGGFIQIRLIFEDSNEPIDASQYKGVKLVVRGSGDGYYVHLNTTSSHLPWAYYSHKFEVIEEWKEVYLEFDNFEPQGMRSPGKMDTDKLTSIAIVAAKKDMKSDIMVSRLEFYK